MRHLLWFCVLIACEQPAPISVTVSGAEPESELAEGPIGVEAGSVESLPPILILTLDTTRADHLGLYGYFRDTSPDLDILASQSLVFDDAIAPMATTLPSHLSLMTGLQPLEHGTLANVLHGGTRFVPGPNVQTFAQLARDAGYQTGAFVSAIPLEHGTGVERGFNGYDYPKPSDGFRPGNETVHRAIQWLERIEKDKPWLLWVHLFDPHNPYVVHENYRFGGDEDVQSQWIAERQISAQSVRPTGEVVHTIPATDAYDSEIAFMDAQIGSLMLAITKMGEHPAILVVGDHGEGLGQHGQPGHGRVWHEQLRVPMMMHVPGGPTGRFEDTVGIIDAMPTLLGQLDFPGTERFLEQASGVDVLAEGVAPRVIYSRQSARQSSQFDQPTTVSLTSKDAKVILAEGQTARLFDRLNDPHELNPGNGDHRSASIRDLEAAQRTRAIELGQAEAEAVSDDTLEQMKALGYIE